VSNGVWQALRARATLVSLYVAGFASCIVGGHLFMVAYDPGSVGGFYLFPFTLIAPAELLGFLPAVMGKRCMRRRPGAAWRLPISAWGYVLVLVVVTLGLERRNLQEPMLLSVVLIFIRQPLMLLLSWGVLADIENIVQLVMLLGVALGFMLPLLGVLFVACRSAERAGGPAPLSRQT